MKDKVFRVMFLGLLAGVVVGIPGQSRPDALVLYRQGEFERAVEVTLEELQENPRNLDSYTVLGWSLLALRRYEDALEYGNRGLEVSRFDHRLVHIVGESHYQQGNYAEALLFLQNYVALAPQGALVDEVYFLIGEIHIQFEEYHHADIAMTTALYLDDSRARWWARLGYAREMAGSPDYARQAYEAALQRNPNLVEARRGLQRLES